MIARARGAGASRRVALLRELTYDTECKGPAAGDCAEAGRKLARHCFSQGDFAEGIKALATTCSENDLPHHLMHPSIGNLFTFVQNLCGSKEEETKKKGERLADAAVAWYRGQATAVKDEKRRPWVIQTWSYAADVQYYAGRSEKQREVYEQMIATLGGTDELLGKLAYGPTGTSSRRSTTRPG